MSLTDLNTNFLFIILTAIYGRKLGETCLETDDSETNSQQKMYCDKGLICKKCGGTNQTCTKCKAKNIFKLLKNYIKYMQYEFVFSVYHILINILDLGDYQCFISTDRPANFYLYNRSSILAKNVFQIGISTTVVAFLFR